MKKKLLSVALVLCMVLTLLPTVALAYEVTDGVATVDNLTDLQAALSNGAVSEIIVSQGIELTNGTTLNGNGKTVRATITGVDENGVVQTGSSYNVFTIPNNATVSVSKMTIMGGSNTAVVNGGTLTMKNVTVTRSGSREFGYDDIHGGGIINDLGKLILKNCSIVRNVAYCAGGIKNENGQVVMDGCSLSENRSLASMGGGGATENHGSDAVMYIKTRLFPTTPPARLAVLSTITALRFI